MGQWTWLSLGHLDVAVIVCTGQAYPAAASAAVTAGLQAALSSSSLQVFVTVRASIIKAATRLNAEVEEREEERWATSLQPVWPQEPKNLVRGICGPYINDERLNYYTNWLRGGQ